MVNKILCITSVLMLIGVGSFACNKKSKRRSGNANVTTHTNTYTHNTDTSYYRNDGFNRNTSTFTSANFWTNTFSNGFQNGFGGGLGGGLIQMITGMLGGGANGQNMLGNLLSDPNGLAQLIAMLGGAGAVNNQFGPYGGMNGIRQLFDNAKQLQNQSSLNLQGSSKLEGAALVDALLRQAEMSQSK